MCKLMNIFTSIFMSIIDNDIYAINLEDYTLSTLLLLKNKINTYYIHFFNVIPKSIQYFIQSNNTLCILMYLFI